LEENMSDVMMNDPNRASTPSEYTTQLATKPAIYMCLVNC
jgi:hypothetical protein